MPYQDSQVEWDDTEFNEDSFFGGSWRPGADPDDYGVDNLDVWKPHDPDSPFSYTIDERNAYRAGVQREISTLSPYMAGSATALGASGFGSAYRPASLQWNASGRFAPQSRVGLGVWGHNRQDKRQFPTLGGAIITPTIDVYSSRVDDAYDASGQRIPQGFERSQSGLQSGESAIADFMKRSRQRGVTLFEQLTSRGMEADDARLQSEREMKSSLRSMLSPYPRESFASLWSQPYALREAISGSATIRQHGDYSIGNRALFQQLGSTGEGYFTRNSQPSRDVDHPERGIWEATSLNSLYALGWLRRDDGGFITGTNKPQKRRQLGVQELAAPILGDDEDPGMMRRGRITGDRMLTTTAVFMDNIPYAEGAGVMDSKLIRGFRGFRPVSLERPMRGGEDWGVEWAEHPGVFGAPGANVELGQQNVGGKLEPLGPVRGIRGISQRLFGTRKTTSGYQGLIESETPAESGMFKAMHYGMKALMFISDPIMGRMRNTVEQAKLRGELPADVQAPRMIMPMPKDWLQAEFGMFNHLPDETLRSIGLSNEQIKSKDWQAVGPDAITKMKSWAEQRRFSWKQEYTVPVERLDAFGNAGNIVGGRDAVTYLKRGGKDYASFTAEHSGYVLPAAFGFRVEHPGKSPMYSPEELMQLAKRYPMVANSLSRGNASSRIWGAALSDSMGVRPEGAISHEELPWVSARMGIDGSLDEEGTARTLIENLGREMRLRKQSGSIIGPNGEILPNPNDVLGQSTMGHTGQEESKFVSSYIRALKIMGTGGDASTELGAFRSNLQAYASGHNVRREALGARLDRAIEGTFTGHMSLPDDVVVAGAGALRTLAGIKDDDEDADEKLGAFMKRIEGGENFFALGTRRPVSDMFNQLGVPMRVITENMATNVYGAEIQNLGRGFAVSTTMAGVWRGDFDADRALIHGVTNARFEKDEEGRFGVGFRTSRDVMNSYNEETVMARQVKALKSHAPEQYGKYFSSQNGMEQLAMAAGLGGDRGINATRALSRALHGIDIDWNESRKWSEELATNIEKNRPQTYEYYADSSRTKNKTSWSREEMLGDFEKSSKSKTLMGRAYNRYLRGLTGLAQSPEELQAATTFASNIYQKALDNQKMTKGELGFFNMMESIGPTGAMFDKFDTESQMVSSAIAGGPGGMLGMLVNAINDTDTPASVKALLFSRDPKIQKAITEGVPTYMLIDMIAGRKQQIGAKEFLEDPNRAGILPQLVQAMHFSKQGIQNQVALSPAQQAYAKTGESIRAQIRVLGRGGKMTVEDAFGNEVEQSGMSSQQAVTDIRNMSGLDTTDWWRKMIAGRMGLQEHYFESPEQWKTRLGRAGIKSYDNDQTSRNNEHFLAVINKSEEQLHEYLRNVPTSEWDGIFDFWKMQQKPSAGANAPDPQMPPGASRAGGGPSPKIDPFIGLDDDDNIGGPMGASDFSKLSKSAPPTPVTEAVFRDPHQTILGSSGRMIYNQVLETYGGLSSVTENVQKIRAWKLSDQSDDSPEFIPNEILREVMARTENSPDTRAAAMKAHQQTMRGLGVGVRSRKSKSGEQRWTNDYSGLSSNQTPGSTSTGARFNMQTVLREVLNEELKRFGPMSPQEALAAFGSGLSQEAIDQGLQNGLTQDVMKGPIMPLIASLMGSGDQATIHTIMRGTNYSMTRLQLNPQGLLGMNKDLLFNMVEKGMNAAVGPNGERQDPYANPEIQNLMEQGYRNSGIGQTMTRRVRNVIDSDVSKLDRKGQWRLWEDIQAVTNANGGDMSEKLIDKQDQLIAAMGKLTDIEIKRADQIEKDPRFKQGLDWAASIPANWKEGDVLGKNDVKRLTNLRNLQSMTGNDTSFIDSMLDRNVSETLLKSVAYGPSGRPQGKIAGLFNKVMGKDPDDIGGTEEEGRGVGGLFTNLALGMTVFRARMAWNMATGAQGKWMDEFMGQERAASGAALMGGAQPGIAGNSSVYISSQAAMQNTKATMGEGVAQVYSPLAGMIGGVNSSASFGAAATLVGTPLGVGSVTAMGAKMVGQSMGYESLVAGAGAIGGIATLATGAVLGTSYLTGLGQNWQTARPDSFGRNLGFALRPSQLAAKEAGLPEWVGTIAGAGHLMSGAITGNFGGSASSYGTAVTNEFQAEVNNALPGTLRGDSSRLRAWADDRYHDKVPVDSMLQVSGSLMQLTGRTAQDVYENKAPNFNRLLDRFASYIQGGASPESVYNSQVQTAGYAGAPLGVSTENFMLQFGDNVPGQMRAQYEEAYKSLQAIPGTLGRQTGFAEATATVGLAEKYGSTQRAATEIMGRTGVGWFTSAYGVQSGPGGAGQLIGNIFSGKDLPTQQTAQQFSSMLSSSLARAGVDPITSASFVDNLSVTQKDNVLRATNMVVQAESVSIRTGMDMGSLINKATAGGFDKRDVASQSWAMQSWGGVSGLAPSSMIPGSINAQNFEDQFAGISASRRQAYTVASGIMSANMPQGFGPEALDMYGSLLQGGNVSVSQFNTGIQAMTGNAGLAPAFGVPQGSMSARMLEQLVIGGPTNLKMTGSQIRGMGGMVQGGLYSRFTGKEIAQMQGRSGDAGPESLRDLYLNQVDPGNMSAYDFNRAQQVETGATPWGMSAQRNFGPGSLTDKYGNPYGQFHEWTATGRQAGKTFAPMFQMQMDAAYASIGAQYAAMPIEHRTFERGQAFQRLQWGTGPFQTTTNVSNVLSGQRQTITDQMSPTEVTAANNVNAAIDAGVTSGQGMKIGDSNIGLVQQEAAIRKQMWQENLAYQQQQIAFARQSLAIAREELALSKEQYGAERSFKLDERNANRAMQMRQRSWGDEDFAVKQERMGITQSWNLEDMQRQRRYAVGRDRVDIERNIQRTMVTQGWEQSDSNKGRSRELELQRHQDARYSAAVAFEEKINELQMRRFGLQESKLNLQEAQLAAQEAHLLAMAGLEADLRKIDEERFAFQYDQTQAQMKDDEALEKIRQDARKAELAFQLAQLANTETIMQAQQDWTKDLEEIKEGGILDAWIAFFAAVRAGPTEAPPPPPPPPGDLDGDGIPDAEARKTRRTRTNQEIGISQGLTKNSVPAIVNFILDGETVFTAVVKQDRLRPVVEEITRRKALR